MVDQKSQLSPTTNVMVMKTEVDSDGDTFYSIIPKHKKYGYENYRVFRIKLPPIDITENMANKVFKEILSGRQAVILGKSLVMCSSISSIDPLPIKKKPITGKIVGNVFVPDKD